MKPIVQARCPVCGGIVEVPYIMLGAPTTCPGCGAREVPEVPVGTLYPRTGFEITFRDFHQLIGERAYRTKVGSLLSRWFDYKIYGDSESSVVRSREEKVVDLLELHLRIQGDPAKQQELYRNAMALWR